MKIIQSFYQIEKNIGYYNSESNDNYLINFYSLLLSFICLNNLGYKVTVYCNKFAYEKMLKFIPYDDVIITDINDFNVNNYGNEWGMLKFNVFEMQKEPFIHLDGDVFLFNDLLFDFIDDNKFDVIIQSVDISKHVYGNFFHDNYDQLLENGYIVDNNELIVEHNGSIGYNNGVVGFKDIDFLKKYIKNAKKMNSMINDGFFKSVNHQTMIFEQFLLYHLTEKYEKNVYEVLPYYEVKKFGYEKVANDLGYTHLLSGNKYVDYFVMLVRLKIYKKYPKYIKNIENFEKTITNANIKYLKHNNLEELIS